MGPENVDEFGAATAGEAKLTEFLDSAAVEAGLEAGLRKERRRFGSRAVAA